MSNVDLLLFTRLYIIYKLRFFEENSTWPVKTCWHLSAFGSSDNILTVVLLSSVCSPAKYVADTCSFVVVRPICLIPSRKTLLAAIASVIVP